MTANPTEDLISKEIDLLKREFPDAPSPIHLTSYALGCQRTLEWVAGLGGDRPSAIVMDEKLDDLRYFIKK